MIKLRLFGLSALMMLFTVATAMAQAPGAAATDAQPGKSWFFAAIPTANEPIAGKNHDFPGCASGAAATDAQPGKSWFFPAMGSFAVGIAAFGGALGDGRAIAAACEGTARNPGAGGRIFTMLLLGLALIETLVLFTFLTVVLKY